MIRPAERLAAERPHRHLLTTTGLQDGLLRRLVTIETGHEFTLVHDRHAVSQSQHLGEIGEVLHLLAPSWKGAINFIPVRGDFTRGILASVYFDCELTEEAAVTLYKDYYAGDPFVYVVETNPDMKMVVNTNKCVLHVRKHGDKLHVISVIDNLVKGASGQAVQNMNLLFGLPEDTGLHLKGTRF